MRKLRTPLTAAFALALAATSLAVPSSAVSAAKLTIVNGVPGKQVDVCVNGREVKSGLRYGRFVFRKSRRSKATIKFYKRDPRRCGGKLLAKKTTGLADATIVITRRSPKKVVVFDNGLIAQPVVNPDHTHVSFRHASDIGPTGIAFDLEAVDPIFLPLAARQWVKGEHDRLLLGADVPRVLVVFAQKSGEADFLLKPWFRFLKGQRRWEVILLGSSRANLRWILVDRPATLAGP